MAIETWAVPVDLQANMLPNTSVELCLLCSGIPKMIDRQQRGAH
jgi:hypothetical protein